MTRGRVTVAVVAALALLAVGAVVYRTFAPQESLSRPAGPFPVAGPVIDEHPFTALRAAPLVVEGRLRVYAEKRRVWADGPVGERNETTPYWALRRWPAELVGVVAAGPLVVSQWSDGELVALAARTGEVAWRRTVPVGTKTYEGRRTGASVVYEPRSLRTATSRGTTVLLTTADGTITALAARTGAPLWTSSVAGCEPNLWTGAGLVAQPSCDGVGVAFLDAVTGAPRGSWLVPARTVALPALCALGRSDCRLVRAGDRAWLLGADAKLAEVPRIEAGAVLAGDRVLVPTPTGVKARRLVDAEPLWTYTGPGALFAADSVGVYLLDPDLAVRALDPATGKLILLGCAAAKVADHWQIGHVYPTDGATPEANFVAIERLTGEPPTAKDPQYYFGPKPVALVELYPPALLPRWSPEWAACPAQLSGPLKQD